MVSAKEKGLIRLEGKEYIMQDGDIVLFRFNIWIYALSLYNYIKFLRKMLTIWEIKYKI